MKQFSKAAGRIKELISNLPVATEDDDIEEAASLKDPTETTNEVSQIKIDKSLDAPSEETSKQESDPFGLDALIPSTAKKNKKTKGKKEATIKIKEGDETKRYLKSQREALITCLEIAALRYKTAWYISYFDSSIFLIFLRGFLNVVKNMVSIVTIFRNFFPLLQVPNSHRHLSKTCI